MKRSKCKVFVRIIKLSEKNYNCSQIMMLLSLEEAGADNVALVRAMGGLGHGCGFFYETCGVLTGAASFLSYYGGKGTDGESESEMLLPMLQELGDWFREYAGEKYEGSKCKEIVGDKVGTALGKKRCGSLIFNTHGKVSEILGSYGFI